MTTATMEQDTTAKPERRKSALRAWEEKMAGQDAPTVSAREQYRKCILSEELPPDDLLDQIGYMRSDAEGHANRYAMRKSAADRLPKLKAEVEQMAAEKQRLRGVDSRERLVETCQTVGELFDALNDVQYPAPPIGGEVHRLSQAKARKETEVAQCQTLLMRTCEPEVMRAQGAADTAIRRANERIEVLRSEIAEGRQADIHGALAELAEHQWPIGEKKQGEDFAAARRRLRDELMELRKKQPRLEAEVAEEEQRIAQLQAEIASEPWKIPENVSLELE